jgi:hypothetical protein
MLSRTISAGSCRGNNNGGMSPHSRLCAAADHRRHDIHPVIRVQYGDKLERISSNFPGERLQCWNFRGVDSASSRNAPARARGSGIKGNLAFTLPCVRLCGPFQLKGLTRERCA